MQIHRFGGGIFTIEGFLTPAECEEFIVRSERLGFSEATITTEEGERLYPDERNNYRVIFEDEALASLLFDRAAPMLPQRFDEWHVCAFNSHFRFYRYEPTQQFAWHKDGTVRVSPAKESFLTFMMYLNANFEGGSTQFGWEQIVPATGTALIFPHRLRHQGAPVVSGTKYVLRTDVFYEQRDTGDQA